MQPLWADAFRFFSITTVLMHLCIFEDRYFTNFLPLAFFRPVYALRCGASELHSKIERALPRTTVAYHCRSVLAPSLREVSKPRVNELEAAPTWFVNGRVLADRNFVHLLKSSPKHPVLFCQGDTVVAAKVDEHFVRTRAGFLQTQVVTRELFGGIPGEDVDVRLIEYPWELIHANGEEIVNDFGVRAKSRKTKRIAGRVHAGAHLVKKSDILLGKGSVVKPGAVLDAEEGPIIVEGDVTIGSNAVIEGPVFIGRGSVIKAGARIHGGTTIGEVCKVGGEVEASILQSYSNKQHDGYLGHSYLGSWVNIGADTNTSDLKNTYGSVQVSLGGRKVDTGLQFVGLFMGDHSKTGINVMFDTGTVAGVSCNVYGAGLPPKSLPSFSWGNAAGKFSVYELERSIETAKRVMMRRNVKWTQSYEQLFRAVFEETHSERAAAGIV
jgi:UDP-N-acetylglucosamine diphosphorylase/glucosamine-1-phosphate N-acetyltransferase